MTLLTAAATDEIKGNTEGFFIDVVLLHGDPLDPLELSSVAEVPDRVGNLG